MIGFYHKRGGDAECYRAVLWPDSPGDQDTVIEEVRQLFGRNRPGTVMIGRELRSDSDAIIAQAEPEACGVYANTVSRNWLTPGYWLVIPQDVRQRIDAVGPGRFERDFE